MSYAILNDDKAAENSVLDQMEHSEKSMDLIPIQLSSQ
jgi:hypothetical protein